MTHEETNLRTKRMLADSLKKFMNKKSLSKITVSEIIKDCNVNRKTFYYHFEDIFDLLKWILDEEAIEVIKQFDLLVDYEDALNFVMDYVEKNSHILNCAFDSVGREQLKRFFYKDFYDITINLIMKIEEQNDIKISEESRNFICNFILEGIIGILINDIKNGERYSRETSIKNVCELINALPLFLKHISSN